MQVTDLDGKKVAIEVLEGEFKTESENDYYSSKIVDVKSEKSIKVALPIIVKAYLVFKNGTNINVHYSYKDTKKSCLYIIPCIIEDLDKNFKPPSIIAYVTGEIIRRQRRNSFRVPYDIESNEIVVTKCAQGKNIKICDISATGLRLISDEKIEMNEEIIITINCKDVDEVTVKGKVVRNRVIEEKLKLYHDIGIEFYDLNTKEKENLNKYITKKQRQMLINAAK